MTVRVQFVFLDDRDEHDHGKNTDIGPDGETVIYALDGEVVELHLTREHASQLRAEARPWLDAGHPPGQEPQESPGQERVQGQGRRREIPGTRSFFNGLRSWAGDEDIEVPSTLVHGKVNYKYPKDLKQRYVSHLGEQAARGGSDGHAAAALLVMAGRLGFPVPGDS